MRESISLNKRGGSQMPFSSISISDLRPGESENTIQIRSSEEVVTVVRNKYKPIPPFIAYGSGKDHYKEKDMHSIDPVRILINLKSRGKAFYIVAYDKLRETNKSLVVHIPRSEMTKTQSGHFYAGYRELRKVDLMRRSSKGRYMFNPRMFILTGYKGDYTELIEQYEKLK